MSKTVVKSARTDRGIIKQNLATGQRSVNEELEFKRALASLSKKSNIFGRQIRYKTVFEDTFLLGIQKLDLDPYDARMLQYVMQLLHYGNMRIFTEEYDVFNMGDGTGIIWLGGGFLIKVKVQGNIVRVIDIMNYLRIVQMDYEFVNVSLDSTRD